MRQAPLNLSCLLQGRALKSSLPIARAGRGWRGAGGYCLIETTGDNLYCSGRNRNRRFARADGGHVADADKISNTRFYVGLV